MEDRAETCRWQAAELRRRAAQAQSPQVREQLLLMALDWDQLAQAAELARPAAAG